MWCAIFSEILVQLVSLMPFEYILVQRVTLNALGELESDGGKRGWVEGFQF